MVENVSSENPPAHAESLGEGGFFGALARRQSYLNILFLALSAPLATAWFVFVVTGLALGFGLAIVGVGLLILLVVLVAVRGLAAVERQLNGILLGAAIPAPDPNPAIWRHPWITLKRYLSDSYTWKALIYFVVKFPIAICGFVILVFLLSTTLTLILTPLLYHFVPMHVFVWRVMRAEEAMVCGVIGLFMGVVSIHVMNGLAAVNRGWAQAMLSGASKPRPQVKTGPIIIP